MTDFTASQHSGRHQEAEALLSVRDLGMSYGSHQVLGRINVDVRAGEFVSIMGPSGAGKTTLLQCLSGLLAPTAGGVSRRGKPVTEPPAGMAIVFQEYSRSLRPWLSLQAHVVRPLRSSKMSPTDLPAKAVAAVKVCIKEADLDLTKLSIGVAPYADLAALKQKHPLPAKAPFTLD